MKTLWRSLLLLTITTSLLHGAYAGGRGPGLDVFVEGCHLEVPIPRRAWLGLYEIGGDRASVVAVALEKSKVRTDLEGDLYEFCVKARPKVKRDQSESVILLSGELFTEGHKVSARIPRREFNELRGKPNLVPRGLPRTEEDIEIFLGHKKYVLHQSTNLDDYAKGDNHVLTLTHGGVRQTILAIRGDYEGATGLKILWAGDLDGDGNLDLVLDAPWHYAEPHHLRIFLSSRAKPGELVRQVAERGFKGV